MPLFTVVVTTHNRRALLEQALTSVRAQTCRDMELVIVDDDSTDGTAEYLASLGTSAKVVRVQAHSPGAARNAGAGVSAGDYVIFLDSDDLWLPWTLATFAEAIARHGRPALVCASFMQFSDAAELARVEQVPLAADVFPDYLSTWPHQLSVGAGMIAVRRPDFEQAGGFAGGAVNLEDHDLTLKLGTARGFVQLRQPLTLGWRLHPKSVTRDLRRSVDGCAMLIAAERAGRYPGGRDRAAARRQIITTHARSVSLECVKAGRLRDAAAIYRATTPWHVALGRWKYLATFPLLLGTTALRTAREA